MDNDDVVRGELREAIRDIRSEWRERLALAGQVRPGKLAERAGVLLLDVRCLDDRIEEAGGEENLVFMLCAQVAGGVTFSQWCDFYGLHRGMVWAWLTQREEWHARYLRALEGAAEGYMGEVVGIADGSGEESVKVDKLRIDTRMKVAGMYNRKRFGGEVEKVGSGGGGVLPAMVQITFVDAADGHPVEGRVIEG